MRMALVEEVVGKWVKTIGEHHGRVKTGGWDTKGVKNQKANHVAAVL